MPRKDLTASNIDNDNIAMRILLTVLKWIGLAPLTVRRTARWKQRKMCAWQNGPTTQFSSSRFGFAYNLCLIASQVCVLILTIPASYRRQNPNTPPIKAAVDMTACATGYFTMFVIWLITGFRGNAMAKLCNQLLSFDGTTLRLNSRHLPESNRLFILLVCAANLVTQLGIMFVDYLARGFVISNYVIYTIPTTVVVWFSTQYTFAVKMIENRLKALNRSLVDCCSPPIVSNRNLNAIAPESREIDTAAENIAAFRRAYFDLNKIASGISAVYSMPILVSIAYCCFALIVSAYYFVNRVIGMSTGEFSIPLFILSLLRLSQKLAMIVLLSTSVTNVTKESKKTIDVVKRLLHHPNNSHDVNFRLECFLLELLHREVRFTACGLFSLDSTMVGSIISAVITYLVILFQF